MDRVLIIGVTGAKGDFEVVTFLLQFQKVSSGQVARKVPTFN